MSNFAKFIKQHKLFADLNSKQLSIVDSLIKEITFEPDEIVMHENDEAKELFIISDGKVEVLKAQESGTLYPITTLKTGDVIGEMALLEDMPRTATIRATTT